MKPETWDRFDDSGAKPVILMVDDDPLNLAVLRDCLLERDYTLLAAEDGESAIERVAYARPDLILLDVMMPGIDGFDTCRCLKARDETRDIPVIFMTALAETDHKIRGFEAGGVDYVTKPFHREELLARIDVHLHIRELTCRLQDANETLEQRVAERTLDLAAANRELEDEIAERQAVQEQLQKQARFLEEKIEELQLAQDSLRKSEQNLRQSQKMEAIGSLAAGIAHDFNNMLTAINGYTEISMMKLGKDSPVISSLTRVREACMRASELVRQILTFSRRSEQEMRPVSMKGIVQEVLKLLRSSLPTTIEIRQDIPDSDAHCMVMANPTQLHQVLMNLGTNAFHAMRTHGGVLSVSLDRVELDAPYASSLYGLTAGAYVLLTVSDTGHGMDAPVMDRIFDPYFTTKESGEGTGLGLSVVLGIIRNHGGTITVSSQPGKGSGFRVFLPFCDSAAAGVQQEEELYPLGKERILIVDDEVTLAILVQEMLKSLGYSVTSRTSSRDALELFRSQPGAFDLVVTDLTMPGMTGVELACGIAAIRFDIPIMLCTGYSRSGDDAGLPELLFSECIQKPYSMSMLARTVRRVLDGDPPAANRNP